MDDPVDPVGMDDPVDPAEVRLHCWCRVIDLFAQHVRVYFQDTLLSKYPENDKKQIISELLAQWEIPHQAIIVAKSLFITFTDLVKDENIPYDPLVACASCLGAGWMIVEDETGGCSILDFYHGRYRRFELVTAALCDLTFHYLVHYIFPDWTPLVLCVDRFMYDKYKEGDTSTQICMSQVKRKAEALRNKDALLALIQSCNPHSFNRNSGRLAAATVDVPQCGGVKGVMKVRLTHGRQPEASKRLCEVAAREVLQQHTLLIIKVVGIGGLTSKVQPMDKVRSACWSLCECVGDVCDAFSLPVCLLPSFDELLIEVFKQYEHIHEFSSLAQLTPGGVLLVCLRLSMARLLRLSGFSSDDHLDALALDIHSTDMVTHTHTHTHTMKKI
eukprot:GHVR01142161.1.p1 GENE.GHVR01142161.1~~GHVR01142161.1.p1  ORF type:complete len:387 (+),score=115.17 GHVR01142161.1:107-1267(+)